jgi:hypothetical protein
MVWRFDQHMLGVQDYAFQLGPDWLLTLSGFSISSLSGQLRAPKDSAPDIELRPNRTR